MTVASYGTERNFQTSPRLKTELPLQFDEATNKTIELIDVLWLKGNAIVAAFEVESTTSDLFRSTSYVGPRSDATESKHSSLLSST